MGVLPSSPEERWERVSLVLLISAGVFGVSAVDGIYSGDDWRGLVMTATPGMLCLALWYTARVRLDHMTRDAPSPLWVKLVGWTFAAGALATGGWLIYGLSSGRLEYRAVTTDERREQEMLQNVRIDPEVLRRMKEVEVVMLPDGSVTTRRKPSVATEDASAMEPPAKDSDDTRRRCPEGQTLVAEPATPDRPICKAQPAPDERRL